MNPTYHAHESQNHTHVSPKHAQLIHAHDTSQHNLNPKFLRNPHANGSYAYDRISLVKVGCSAFERASLVRLSGMDEEYYDEPTGDPHKPFRVFRTRNLAGHCTQFKYPNQHNIWKTFTPGGTVCKRVFPPCDKCPPWFLTAKQAADHTRNKGHNSFRGCRVYDEAELKRYIYSTDVQGDKLVCIG